MSKCELMSLIRCAWFAIFLVMAAPLAAQAAITGIDCQRTEGDVEVLVCASPKLLALEREVMRLYGLAENGYRAKVREGELAQTQQEWVMARDTCWKTPDPSVCIVDQSLVRIGELRRDYYDSQLDDAKGISSGPVRWACKGMNATVTAVSVRTDPALMQLTWKGTFATLTREGPGLAFRDGGYAFNPIGSEATFTLPSAPPMNCRIEPKD
jgi:uncharacterized protein